MKRKISLIIALLVIAQAAQGTLAIADVRLPALFSDQIVLQRDEPVAVWGWADPGEKVTVDVAGQSKSATADADGRWLLKLDALEAGGPHKMSVQGRNRIEIDGLLVGEVWLCSGQSNMAMAVRGCDNAGTEIAATDLPNVRMFTVARKASDVPTDDCSGEWLTANPENVGGFSATAFFFGRKLHEETGVPVGLINSSWGGTPVEAWTDRDLQTGLDFEPITAAWTDADSNEKKKLSAGRPGNLYDGMICPLLPYGIRGAIWYQGERNSNGPNANLYAMQMATMISDWRKQFKQADFPFGIVQLPNFKAPQEQPSEPSGWVTIREQMDKAASDESLGMVGLAVTIDIGDAKNIHPKNKQEVGRRLALWALDEVYGQDIVAGGPLMRSAKKHGNSFLVQMAQCGEGLKTSDGEPVRGFVVAGEDRVFHFANAKIIDTTGVVLVDCPDVKQPVAVRYAWAANPDSNLVNSEGLPTAPLRSDDWDDPVVGR